jgi:hypothetical protein
MPFTWLVVRRSCASNTLTAVGYDGTDINHISISVCHEIFPEERGVACASGDGITKRHDLNLRAEKLASASQNKEANHGKNEQNIWFCFHFEQYFVKKSHTQYIQDGYQPM